MILHPDGTFDIDFAPDQKVHVRKPNVGQYRRLREEMYLVDSRQAEQTDQWRAEQDTARKADGKEDNPDRFAADETDLRRRSEQLHMDLLLEWWQLALVGTEDFAALADGAVPEDSASWPMELAANTSLSVAVAHWLTPLVLGGAPELTTSDETQAADR